MAERGRPSLSAAPRCKWCDNTIGHGLPFCAHCGRRTDAELAAASACATCGAPLRPDLDSFCSSCGAPIGNAASPDEAAMRSLLFAARRRALGAELALLDEHGAVKQRLTMESSTLTIGRDGCDLVFPDDPYVSPIHAQLAVRDGALFVRDLGSTNHTWVFLDAPHHLLDDDLLLIGSQLIRFESIGTPAIVEPDVDPARRFGSHVPGTDVARLLQLRSDGSVRDAQYLVLGRTRSIGRDTGDWTFPYDQTMSGRHAEIHEHDGRFTLHDLGSRNGVAVAVRGELSLAAGQRLMVGDQVLRVERV